MENFIGFCTNIPLKIGLAIVISISITCLYHKYESTKKPPFAILICTLPVLLFFFAILTLVCDVPFWDDYDAILNFLNQPLASRIRSLFSFHNEHRLLIPRLCFEGIRAIHGTFSFSLCIVLGDLILLLYVYLLGSRTSRLSGLQYFTPFIWLFLSLANYENTLWALTAIQSHAVLLFSLLACLILDASNDSKFGFPLSIICAFAATFTSGSGMGIWPALVIVYLMKKRTQNTPLRKSILSPGFIILLIVALVSIGGYMIGFAENSARLAAEAPAASTPPPSSALTTLASRLDFALSFLGGIVPFHAVALPFGVLVSVVLVFIFLNTRRIRDIALFGFWLYLLSIVAAGAVFRGSAGGSAAVALRYGIVSFSILTCTTVLAMSIIDLRYNRLLWLKRIFAPVFMFGCVLINIGVLLLGYKLLDIRRSHLVDGIQDMETSAQGLQHPEPERARTILQRAISLGVYTPPRPQKTER